MVYPLNPEPNAEKKIEIARWVVASKKELFKLIEIFNNHTLNTTKYLDFINWRNAYLLCFMTETPVSNLAEWKEERNTKILNLQSSMNDKRTNFVYPPNHKIKISPYWLHLPPPSPLRGRRS